MLPKIQKVNLSSQLIDTMIGLIEEGTWTVGSRLPSETELASSFNVSRNIMRESLKILENFGILNSKMGVGTSVSNDAIRCIHSMHFFQTLKNNASFESLFETRLIIEPELAYYATLRATPDDVAALRDIVGYSEKRHQETNFTNSDDFEFHAHIAKYSGNLILADFLSTILDQIRSGEYAKFNIYANDVVKSRSFLDHFDIVDAMEKKDALLAKDIMYKHLFGRITVINSAYNTELEISKGIKKRRIALINKTAKKEKQ